MDYPLSRASRSLPSSVPAPASDEIPYDAQAKEIAGHVNSADVASVLDALLYAWGGSPENERGLENFKRVFKKKKRDVRSKEDTKNFNIAVRSCLTKMLPPRIRDEVEFAENRQMLGRPMPYERIKKLMLVLLRAHTMAHAVTAHLKEDPIRKIPALQALKWTWNQKNAGEKIFNTAYADKMREILVKYPYDGDEQDGAVSTFRNAVSSHLIQCIPSISEEYKTIKRSHLEHKEKGEKITRLLDAHLAVAEVTRPAVGCSADQVLPMLMYAWGMDVDVPSHNDFFKAIETTKKAHINASSSADSDQARNAFNNAPQGQLADCLPPVLKEGYEQALRGKERYDDRKKAAIAYLTAQKSWINQPGNKS